jgi:hypothetical protein
MYTGLKYQGETPYINQYTVKKMKDRKNRSCPELNTSGRRGGQKERVKEGKYGGYILHSCMKIEQRNLLKLL